MEQTSKCVSVASLLSVVVVLYLANMVTAGVVPSQEHTCGHTSTQLHDDVFYNVHMEPEHVMKKRSVDQPLRIQLYFDKSLNSLPWDHQQLVKNHVETAVVFWESTLKIRANNLPIKLRRKCLSSQLKFRNYMAYCMTGCDKKTVCGDTVIPEDHLEGCMYYNQSTGEYVQEPSTAAGISNTDFILYIATGTAKKCREGQTIAYAAHCQQEQGLDRPVAGFFSICPNSISMSRQNQEQLLSTMKHEILHALGFTASLYAFFRDEAGNPLTPRSPVTGRPVDFRQDLGMHQWSQAVVQEVERSNWLEKSGVRKKTIKVMVTPRVKTEVQKHFNCSTLEGAELEDQGIEGTRLTHWEKRVFENEAMTGTYTQNSVISRITLAMMEDTGWYKADYSQAEDYEWGRDLGCEFVLNSCYHWISSRMARGESIYPFCNHVKKGELWTVCAHNRQSVALCNLVEHSETLDPNYQYFDSLPDVDQDEIGKYGGSVGLADYCPYLQEFSWTNENNVPVRGSNCEDSENNLDNENNVFGETYGDNSLCFEHEKKWLLHQCSIPRSPQHSGSGCYEYSCLPGVGLIIKVLNQSYQCYKKNQVLRITFRSRKFIHEGRIKCPACSEICRTEGMICPPDRDPPNSTMFRPHSFCRGSLIVPLHHWIIIMLLVVVETLYR